MYKKNSWGPMRKVGKNWSSRESHAAQAYLRSTIEVTLLKYEVFAKLAPLGFVYSLPEIY
jgi:uncharacterized protein (DUF736 family)